MSGAPVRRGSGTARSRPHLPDAAPPRSRSLPAAGPRSPAACVRISVDATVSATMMRSPWRKLRSVDRRAARRPQLLVGKHAVEGRRRRRRGRTARDRRHPQLARAAVREHRRARHLRFRHAIDAVPTCCRPDPARRHSPPTGRPTARSPREEGRPSPASSGCPARAGPAPHAGTGASTSVVCLASCATASTPARSRRGVW